MNKFKPKPLSQDNQSDFQKNKKRYLKQLEHILRPGMYVLSYGKETEFFYPVVKNLQEHQSMEAQLILEISDDDQGKIYPDLVRVGLCGTKWKVCDAHAPHATPPKMWFWVGPTSIRGTQEVSNG